MLELNSLSRIGFGCYRISRNSREHYEALNIALSEGCNLIDTSSNYSNGESEKLVGEVLAKHSVNSAFIVTKAGYLVGESEALYNELGLAKEDLVRTPNGSLHSIHPVFLDSQIKLSCRRLNRSTLDGLLLHNPEYYFSQIDQATSQGEYYARIKRAFEFLEDQVEQGRVRYYGISSNTFPFSTGQKDTTNLLKVLELAKEVSSSHHFKLIQFPFNLIENDAQKPHHEGLALIEAARANGIVTMSNRPLNANASTAQIRIATYEDEIRNLDVEKDRRCIDECLELLHLRLKEIGIEDDIMEFVPIQMIYYSWSEFRSPEVVDQVFDQHLLPFLEKLYEGSSNQEVFDSFAKLRRMAGLYAKRKLTQISQVFRRQMIEQGIIGEHDNRPLPTIACQIYLDAGIDHVLVGMRSQKYVKSLTPLFRKHTC